MRKVRVMCVCAGGNVRSHGLAYLLKSWGHSAFPVGIDHFETDAMTDLAAVVDHVVTTEQNIHQAVLERLPATLHDRVCLLPIGRDKWGPSIPQELLTMCQQLLEASALRHLKKS